MLQLKKKKERIVIQKKKKTSTCMHGSNPIEDRNFFQGFNFATVWLRRYCDCEDLFFYIMHS